VAWFKVDDGFSHHRKVKALRRGTERLRAIGLWTLAGSWLAEEEIGPVIPDYLIDELGATQKDVDALVRVGLWKVVDDATVFHDWDHFQPDAETLQAQRIKQSVSGQLGNHRRWHVKGGITVPNCEFCHRVPDRDPDGESDRVDIGQGSPVPVPEPHISPNGEMKPPRPDAERLCEHLADRIEANGSKRPSITTRWLDAARLLLDNDGRTEAEVHRAIDWCQADEFWRANVLSMPKLRERFDQMRLQAESRQKPAVKKNDIDWEAAAARAAARETTEPERKELV